MRIGLLAAVAIMKSPLQINSDNNDKLCTISFGPILNTKMMTLAATVYIAACRVSRKCLLPTPPMPKAGPIRARRATADFKYSRCTNLCENDHIDA
jgi:hypothetical protein